MEALVSYRPDVWQPLANLTPAGWVSHRRRNIKKPCPTTDCQYHVTSVQHEQSLARVCPGTVSRAPLVSERTEAHVHCDDNAARISAAGIRLLLGVHSGPASVDRRDGIRSTWMQWQRTTSTLACFLLGRNGVEPALLQRTEAEAVQRRDVLWLDFNASEGARPRLTIAKVRAHGTYTPHVHRMCTDCAPHVHRMCTACTPHIHLSRDHVAEFSSPTLSPTLALDLTPP